MYHCLKQKTSVWLLIYADVYDDIDRERSINTVVRMYSQMAMKYIYLRSKSQLAAASSVPYFARLASYIAITTVGYGHETN